MKLNMTRRGVVGGLAASIAAPICAHATAPAVLSGKGQFRALSIVNHRTGEKLNSVYWIDGSYIPEALEAFNYVLRDWRQNQSFDMDIRVLDIMAATQNLLDTNEPFQIVSGYRSPKTNAMLRARSRGVARNSYHTRGMAVDLALDTRSVGEMARAAKALSAGGVGRYSRSQFVHVDSGPVRSWGR